MEHLEILSRTPKVLAAQLSGLAPEWLHTREIAEAWSPFEVLGHLVHGEQTDWVPRVVRLLEHGEQKPFEPFDRSAHLDQFEGEDVEVLLRHFSELRRVSLASLAALQLDAAQMERTGTHPAFGRVKLSELLATWVVHDLGHLAQISRVMARRWGQEVGPWVEFLPVLTR